MFIKLHTAFGFDLPSLLLRDRARGLTALALTSPPCTRVSVTSVFCADLLMIPSCAAANRCSRANQQRWDEWLRCGIGFVAPLSHSHSLHPPLPTHPTQSHPIDTHSAH